MCYEKLMRRDEVKRQMEWERRLRNEEYKNLKDAVQSANDLTEVIYAPQMPRKAQQEPAYAVR